MGMFDYVKYEAPCTYCGEKLVDWQSKDGECNLEMLEPKDVDCFYTSCSKCETWIEYKVNRVCNATNIRLME